MALNKSKGFVYTLEAIISSALVLGVVLTVLPGFSQQTDLDPKQKVSSGLKTLDTTGKLTDNISATEIESEIEPYVPSSYNHSVAIIKMDTEYRNISSPYEEKFQNKEGGSDLQIWINSADGLNISFDGKTILENQSSTGYKQFSLSENNGWLNFTGDSNLEFQLNSYSNTNPNQDIKAERIYIASYTVTEDGMKEIQVRLWK